MVSGGFLFSGWWVEGVTWVTARSGCATGSPYFPFSLWFVGRASVCGPGNCYGLHSWEWLCYADL